MGGLLLLLALSVSSLPELAFAANFSNIKRRTGRDGISVCSAYPVLQNIRHDANCAAVIRSFLAGALPLSMSLSPSQLRLLSSIGVGILVGTSLIVIIPEGVEAIASAGAPAHSHSTRDLQGMGLGLSARWEVAPLAQSVNKRELDFPGIPAWSMSSHDVLEREESDAKKSAPEAKAGKHDDAEAHSDGPALPTFFIGFALMSGFVLMFLIDRLPRHTSDQFHSAPATRHISLDNLASSGGTDEEESEGFLGSLAPTPKQTRSLATTTGLVIHAAADGIAMGASASTENMKLGLIIFMAIMIHKAPAAFGLTSILLKQGLPKRAARGHLIIFSLAAPVGALATYVIISLLGGGDMDGERGPFWTGVLLLFSGGTFLYVAVDLF